MTSSRARRGQQRHIIDTELTAPKVQYVPPEVPSSARGPTIRAAAARHPGGCRRTPEYPFCTAPMRLCYLDPLQTLLQIHLQRRSSSCKKEEKKFVSETFSTCMLTDSLPEIRVVGHVIVINEVRKAEHFRSVGPALRIVQVFHPLGDIVPYLLKIQRLRRLCGGNAEDGEVVL